MTAREHDDWMDLADAVGVTRIPIEKLLTDDHLAAVIASWNQAAAASAGFLVDLDVDPEAPIVDVAWTDEQSQLDHAECSNDDCIRIVCGCHTPCLGVSEISCLHQMVLCEDCRSECVECRLDAAYDGPGWDL